MIPLRFAVHNTKLPPQVRAEVRRRVEHLRHYYDRITSCRVTIEVTQRRRRTDAHLYRARVALWVPRGSIVIDRQPRHSLAVALDEAFRVARRRLQDHARKIRRVRKTATWATDSRSRRPARPEPSA